MIYICVFLIIIEIDYIVVDFDSVLRKIYTKVNEEHDALRFKKNMSDGTYCAFEVLYKQRKLLNT